MNLLLPSVKSVFDVLNNNYELHTLLLLQSLISNLRIYFLNNGFLL